MLTKAALLALAVPGLAAVHEQLQALPVGWTESKHTVSEGQQMQLQVALQYQNIDSLESKLKAVSSPSSPDYGNYLDLGDISSAFAPSSDSEARVKSWLQESGASHITSDGGLVSFTTTVGQANNMLSTSFKLYTDGARTKLGTTGYSVPDDLSDSIDLITPTTYLGSMKAHAALPQSASQLAHSSRDVGDFDPSCQMTIPYQVSANQTKNYTVIGPTCLKELYNIGDYTPDPQSGSTIAFGSFLNESASYSDLAQFEEIYGLPSQNFSVLALINGGVDNQDPLTEIDGEANLDVQNIVGLVGGLPVGEYITGGSPPFQPDLFIPNASLNTNEPYLNYYQYLLSQPNSDLPYVISNSYGDIENTVPQRYAKRVCNMIGMMGLRGRTILESSGDLGVGAVCLKNGLSGAPEFDPIFPATCPYVTSVGGTQSVLPEVAWNASSGGFSDYFPIAWYQETAVNTYLTSYISASTKEYYSSNGYVDFTGRGFPDISAHSLWPDYLTVINGTASPNGGTSAAAPVVGAIIALLNDARFRAGKPAMGFINPWLYSTYKDTLLDITEGGAVGCAGVSLQTGQEFPGAGIIPFASWNATVGWAPVTGLGVPDFMSMKTVALEAYSSNSTWS